MVLNDEHIQGLAEMESCTQQYFDARILPVMRSVENKLKEAQKEELIEYSTSVEGILSSMGSLQDVQPVRDWSICKSPVNGTAKRLKTIWKCAVRK